MIKPGKSIIRQLRDWGLRMDYHASTHDMYESCLQGNSESHACITGIQPIQVGVQHEIV